MSPLLVLNRSKSRRFSLPDTDDFREHFVDAFEHAMDQADRLPSRSDISRSVRDSDIARGVRKSEIARMVRSAAVAGAPMAASVAHGRFLRRRRSRWAAASPALLMRMHPVAAPVVIGVTVAGAAFATVAILRRRRRIASDEAQLEAASEAATLESFAAIDRLEDEGGALAAAPANGSGRLPR